MNELMNEMNELINKNLITAATSVKNHRGSESAKLVDICSKVLQLRNSRI